MRNVQIIGLTADINECDQCGRDGLRHTVEISTNGESAHFGTSCAASIFPTLGTGRDIASLAAKLCDCGCGRFASVRYRSGIKLFAGCAS